MLSTYDCVDIQPHIHALGLPMEFPCVVDEFCAYTLEQKICLLAWAKQYLVQAGVDACAQAGWLQDRPRVLRGIE